MTASARPPRTPAASRGSRCCASSHRGVAGLWVAEAGPGHHRSVRPRRRDLRHLHPSGQGRGVRGARHQRHTHLGGDDFDRVLVDWLLEDIHAKHGADLSGTRRRARSLRLAAEAAKCRLSFEARNCSPSRSATSSTAATSRARIWKRASAPSWSRPSALPAGAPRRRACARRRGRSGAGGRLHPGAAGAGGWRRCSARRRTASSIPTRWCRGRRCRPRSWPAGSPTCCCWTSRRCRWASRPWAGS